MTDQDSRKMRVRVDEMKMLQLSGALCITGLSAFVLTTALGEEIEVLPTVDVVSGLVREFRSVSDHSVRGRPGLRGRALMLHGGGNTTELGVIQGLTWLKDNQCPDGSWQEDLLPPGKTNTSDLNKAKELTAMALLAFLGQGNTRQSTKYGDTVRKAEEFLVKSAVSNTMGVSEQDVTLSDLMASVAICESLSLGDSDESILSYCATAKQRIVAMQSPEGCWRLLGRQETGPSTYWCTRFLVTLSVTGRMDADGASCLKKSQDYLLSICNQLSTSEKRDALSEEWPAVLAALQLHGSNFAYIVDGVWMRFEDEMPQLRKRLFESGKMYELLWLTDTAFNRGGTSWKEWNRNVTIDVLRRRTVLKNENTVVGACYWKAPDDGKQFNGSVRATAVCVTMLEVYYRSVPHWLRKELK